jgi:hypothetical protein
MVTAVSARHRIASFTFAGPAVPEANGRLNGSPWRIRNQKKKRQDRVGRFKTKRLVLNHPKKKIGDGNLLLVDHPR